MNFEKCVKQKNNENKIYFYKYFVYINGNRLNVEFNK